MTNQITLHNQGNFISTTASIDNMFRIAQAFSESLFIPAHFRGKPADCFVALNMAKNMNEDPFLIMQNIYLVKGTPGWKTQYLIARAANCGVFSGGITWDIEGEGKDLRVTAKATLAKTGEVVTSPVVDFKMAQGEGWTENKKYQTMPELMFRYRSAAFLIRLYAPQVMLGYQTVEEVETLPPAIEVEPKRIKKQEAVQIAHTHAPELEPVSPEVISCLLGNIEDSDTIECLTALKLGSKKLLASIKQQQPNLYPEIVDAFQSRADAIRNPVEEPEPEDEHTAA